jgi:hypothetical protein
MPQILHANVHTKESDGPASLGSATVKDQDQVETDFKVEQTQQEKNALESRKEV